MTQRVVMQLIFDLSGDDISENAGGTDAFSFRGINYTTDLTDKEAAGFVKAISVYAEHMTRVGGHRKSTSVIVARDFTGKDIRAWAEQHVVDVSSRGRVHAERVGQCGNHVVRKG